MCMEKLYVGLVYVVRMNIDRRVARVVGNYIIVTDIWEKHRKAVESP